MEIRSAQNSVRSRLSTPNHFNRRIYESPAFQAQRTGLVTNSLLALSMLGMTCLGLSTGTAKAAPVGNRTQLTQTQETPTAQKVKRRVYVVSGGMNDPDNSVAKRIVERLQARKISSDDIVLMPSQYPAIVSGPLLPKDLKNARGVVSPAIQTGRQVGKTVGDTTENAALNWLLYEQTSDPNSDTSKIIFKILEMRLRQSGIKAPEMVDIVWIGASAGGQLGLTMAERAAQEKSSIQFHTIVTLGSPIIRNGAPEEVRIIACVSPQDQVVKQLSRPKVTKRVVGKPVHPTPPNLDKNDEIRSIKIKLPFFQRWCNPLAGLARWQRPEVLDEALKGILP